MPRKARVNSFSIYLIKEGAEFEQVIRPFSYSYETTISDEGTEIGHLYVSATPPHLPAWAKVFNGLVEPSRIGSVAASSAVLVISSNGRKFAITFGQGRYLLISDCWEEKYGLLVALNSVGEKNIKSIDKISFDSISKQSREQASREVAPQDFGLDVERDLLRAVTGSPKDSTLGERISGMDPLKVSVRAEIKDLPSLLSKYYEKYQDDSYKENYPWVDHLMEVKDRTMLQQLDLQMIDKISANDFNGLWLAAPDIIEWDQVEGFRFGLAEKNPIHHDIHFPDFLEELGPDVPIDKSILTRRHVHCVGDDRTLDKWPVYKCICCETDFEGQSFLLSGGVWYRVSRDFVEEVNRAYALIPKVNLRLPEFNLDTEAEYNAMVAGSDSSHYALMDKQKIFHGGGHSQVEFCDLYTSDRSLIHLKRYGTSSVLSHLFSQGVVSGELFQTDIIFRQKVNEHLPASHKIENINNPPERGQYSIIFAVISDSSDEKLHLPFFSRLNVRHAVRRLQGYGYNVAISKILVSQERKVLKKYVE